jgi:uncharacterized protein (DUF849 family)
MQNKFIINVCLTGMVATKKDDSYVSLVERIIKIRKPVGKSPCTISETRQCLGL